MKYINKDNSHYSGGFRSNVVSKSGCGGMRQKGGYGYSMEPFNSNLFSEGFKSYTGEKVNNPSNMKGGSGDFGSQPTYYSLGGGAGEDLRIFAGSGYPPLRSPLSQGCQGGGGKKRRKKSAKRRKRRTTRKRKTMGKRKHYHHPKKRQASRTRKGRQDFVTHKHDKYYNRRGHRQTGKHAPYKRRKSTRRRRRQQRGGGCGQYMSNTPFSLSYKTGGSLSPSNSSLANPVPFTPTNNCMGV